MKNIKVEIYTDILLQIKRGNHRGKIINAKPLFILNLIELVEKSIITTNCFYFNDVLSKSFEEIQKRYNQNISPMYYPYYYLATQNFWHHKYKINSTKKTQYPSAKFIKDNIEYAYLDNALWDLLQDVETREYFKERIINAYLQ